MFALLSLNKIIQELPALLLTGIYGHDTPKCEYACGHLTALLYKILVSVLPDLTSMNQSCVITQRPHFCDQRHGNLRSCEINIFFFGWGGVRAGGTH
jgi:hypothetical protein